MMFPIPSFSEFQCLVDIKSKELVVVCTGLDHEKIRCGNGCNLQCTLVPITARGLDPKPSVRVWLTTLPRNWVMTYYSGTIVTSTRNPVRTPSESLYRDRVIG